MSSTRRWTPSTTGSSSASCSRSLPEREQTIVYLRFFEGRTQSEIADEIGISQMHVSRLLVRSLATLGRARLARLRVSNAPRSGARERKGGVAAHGSTARHAGIDRGRALSAPPRSATNRVLEVVGEIDVATSPDPSLELAELLRDEPEHVTLDFAHVAFIDSSGLGVLVGALKRLRETSPDAVLRVAHTQGAVRNVFDITGLDELFELS